MTPEAEDKFDPANCLTPQQVRIILHNEDYPERIMIRSVRWHWILLLVALLFVGLGTHPMTIGPDDPHYLRFYRHPVLFWSVTGLIFSAAIVFGYFFFRSVLRASGSWLFLDDHGLTWKYSSRKAMFAAWNECTRFEHGFGSLQNLTAGYTDRGQTIEIPNCKVVKPSFGVVSFNANFFGLDRAELKILLDHYQAGRHGPDTLNPYPPAFSWLRR
ncbi:hypothetical protein [Pyruvatibacter mobilis]|uniref:hypothetical protein n=1 Tax=Pyruvatibacter mobilis TaxID=1712261 RepID=UPI003BAC79EE